MKNGLRFDFVEKMGLTHLVKGDTIWHDSFGEFVLRYDIETKPISLGTEVTFFADRKNTGEQPVPDDLPVAIYDEYGTFINKGKANSFFWFIRGKGSINSWKPDYDKLLEMQKLHDRDQPKSVTIELREYQTQTVKDVAENSQAINKRDEFKRHELKSNVEYYSPVTGYKYKFFDYNLHFFSGAGVWLKSGIEKISSLQLRERVKPVVVGYAIAMNNGEHLGVMTHERFRSNGHFFTNQKHMFKGAKLTQDGKLIFRPIYKKD